MSESHARRKSDFSIARILSEDSKVSCDVKNCGEIVPSVSTYSLQQDNVLDDNGDVVDVETVDNADKLKDQRLGSVDLCDEEGKDSSSCSELGSQGNLQWLQCTRYRPPRLPRRTSTGRNCKRRPATHPRIPFTTFQLEVLEDKYKIGPYLTRKDVLQLAGILRLPQSRVKIWFQNRRARDRRESKVSSSLAIT